MIDLPMHSQESDGSLTPDALAVACRKAGLTAAALTDHDTLGGCHAFLSACQRENIKGIAAVELSADFSPGTMHVLGYLPADAIDAMQPELGRIQSGRKERNREILKALAEINCPVTEEEVASFSTHGMTGRPHIAAAMQARGYVKDRQEAFACFLGKGCPAYRDRYRLAPLACIQMIRKHGGVAVLAHPFTLKLSEKALDTCVGELADAGLQGIEVFYPEHSEERRRIYQRIARTYDLILTGGSDFHGAMNPAIMLGRGFGNVYVDDSVLDALSKCMRTACPPALVSREEHEP